MRLCGITASIATPWSFVPSPRPLRKSKTGPYANKAIKD